jgi:hypothetical protein
MLQYSKRMFVISGITLGLLVAAPTLADQTRSTHTPVQTEAGYTHPGSIRGFNPQPEPPANLRGFNPQPDPPASGFENPGSIRGFNPQPEPPGELRGFNPQPEPPPLQVNVMNQR